MARGCSTRIIMARWTALLLLPLVNPRRYANGRAHRPQWRPKSLFVDDFDLLIEYLSGKPIDRQMHPVTLLTFDDEPVLKTCSIRWIAAALGDHIKHKVPGPCLSCFTKCACDRFAFCLGNTRPKPGLIPDQSCQTASVGSWYVE